MLYIYEIKTPTIFVKYDFHGDWYIPLCGTASGQSISFF